ncbi:MAG: ATP synthase F0 subunit B [Desulfobacterales bacterium]|nr:ATP synthase F0 subunit B [Pseudomonadota bacterium]MCG2770641.1 ATP synthase F0 subunit B [Desulfobacterales bacterium]
MNGGRRSGWQRIGAAFWGLGAVLLLLGVAAPSEAAGGISAEKIQELLWRTVNFVVFAGILVYLLAKPAKKFFAKRSQDVATTLEEMAAKQAEFEAAVAAAEARLAAVAKERQNVIQQFIAEGEMEKAKILDKANLVAARIKEMAAFTIEQETKKAAQSLKEEVVGLATQMATDMIKEKATYTDQQGLVEEYLKKVVETH